VVVSTWRKALDTHNNSLTTDLSEEEEEEEEDVGDR